MHSRSRKDSSSGGFWEKGCWGALRPVLFLVFSPPGEGLELTIKEMVMRRLRGGLQCGLNHASASSSEDSDIMETPEGGHQTPSSVSGEGADLPSSLGRKPPPQPPIA